jgi:hypothetical protein
MLAGKKFVATATRLVIAKAYHAIFYTYITV